MGPLRALPFREVVRKLRAAGFEETSQRGSHIKLIRDSSDGVRTVIVPRHGEVAAGTVRSILRQAHLSVADFDVF